MTKTALSVVMAIILVAASIGTALARRHILGRHFDGGPSSSGWRVTVTVTGELTAPDASLTTTIPLDFRRQHILDERFQSKDLLTHTGRSKEDRRELVWRRTILGGSQPFRVTVSYRCLIALKRPTAAMVRQTQEIDAQPAPGVYLGPTARIEADNDEIRTEAQELAKPDMIAADQVRAMYERVRQLETEPSLGRPYSAKECLRRGGADSGGKSRLLVALCRNRGIPARIVSGLILSGSHEQALHQWAEAWVDGHWLPMCPTYNHFGFRGFPQNYLVLQLGDSDVVRCRGGQASFGFVVQNLHRVPETDDDKATPSTSSPFWQHLSLYHLRPAEQRLVKFLLLLPLGALVVSFFRTVIGLPTFGTFGPALLGMVFRDVKALNWGLPIFIAVVLVGWGMRHLLERFHLLQVPRTAALLTLVISFLVITIAVASHFGILTTQYIALFPLIILTHLVERFWTLEAEDSAVASFKTLLGTVFVAVTVSLTLAPEFVSSWLFRYPETLGGILAVQLVLGRYTGYRLSELYRFGDLIREPTVDHAPPTEGKQ